MAFAWSPSEERICYDSGRDRMSLAADIMYNGEWTSCPTRSPSLLEAWQSLLTIDRLHRTDENNVIWTATSNEKFTTKPTLNVI